MRTTMRIDDVLALLKANEAYGVRKCIEEIEKMQEQYRARRCNTCKHFIGKKTSIGTECMQPNLQRKWKGNTYHRTARYKVPSTPACKYYEEKNADDTYCTDETCETFLRDLNCDNCTR